MIPEPQRTYILELLAALGSAADDFVVAGLQALKFIVAEAPFCPNLLVSLDFTRLWQLVMNWVNLAQPVQNTGP